MDNHAFLPAESQQIQHYYQQQTEATAPIAYDPSTQAYYASYQHPNQDPHQPQPQPQPGQPDYSSYYYPDYSSAYQSHSLAASNSIHPPGAAIPAETPQTLVPNHPDVYYNHGFVNAQHQQLQHGYTAAPSYSAFAAGGGRGDRSIRGGHHSSRGRGRGRGGRGGMRGQIPQPSSSVPRQAFRCEICKVDCDTSEVLEIHKNGKKHKKNMQVYEERQNAKGQLGLQNPDSGGGFKRNLRGGYGGKLMKSSDGSGKPVQFSKPKKAVDLFCSLCSVKCESQAVYNSHMVGKKHLSNVKKLGLEAATTGSGVQAFCPPIPEIPSTQQALYPPTPNFPAAPTPNQQPLFEPNKALASTPVVNDQQGGVEDARVKLVQILTQHGVQDVQGLLLQMIPVLLNGATSNGTGLVTQYQQDSVAHVPYSENESKPETVVGERLQKTELSEGVADMSSVGSLATRAEVTEPPTIAATTCTDQASVDGRENELVAD